MSANYRSSPPSAHQQYLDINGGRERKKRGTRVRARANKKEKKTITNK